MTALDRLTALKGVLAAFDFGADGSLGSHVIRDSSRLDAEALQSLAHLCAANFHLAALQGRGWRRVTGLEGFDPVQSFTLIGMDWSVIMDVPPTSSPLSQGESTFHRAVVISNREGSFDAVNAALQPPEDRRG
ncbi:MAG: DUF2173 family protein [Candidatus Competibacterales bacterium]